MERVRVRFGPRDFKRQAARRADLNAGLVIPQPERTLANGSHN